MVATINSTLISRNIGPADIYVDCTVPAANTPMALAAGGIPTGGRHVGATQGEAVLNYTPTLETIQIEQVSGGVAPRMTAEVGEITFTMLERDYQNMLLAIGQGTGTTSGGVNLITFGGKRAVTPRCIVLVAKSSDEDTYDVAVLYQAINMAGASRVFVKGGTPGIQCTFQAVQVFSRPEGDRGGQLLDDVVPAA